MMTDIKEFFKEIFTQEFIEAVDEQYLATAVMARDTQINKLQAELEEVQAERDKLQTRIDGADKVFVIIEKTTTKYLEIDGTKVGSDAMYKQYLLMDPRAYEQITALILRDESEG